ncbi:hypothetical protein ACFVUW_28725 [Streptomyces xiamenensis]|uniref:hypothetical protein n=1 Tax=Streptomyces xiamenensis TaxID=408015 RepID=UPI0036F02B6E
MSTLVIGRWLGDALAITKSLHVTDGDQDSIEAAVRDAPGAGTSWACEFDVDTQQRSVQRAYEEFVRDEDARLLDDAEGYEPTTA